MLLNVEERKRGAGKTGREEKRSIEDLIDDVLRFIAFQQVLYTKKKAEIFRFRPEISTKSRSSTLLVWPWRDPRREPANL
jgi:hypothetical protein